MTKLKLESRNGDFVHANQVMAGSEGHKCVSKIWYDKTIDLGKFIDKIEVEKKERNDIVVKPGDLQVTVKDNGLRMLICGKEFIPTPHAWKQSCLWLDVPQTMFNHYTTSKMVNNKEMFKRDDRHLDLISRAFNLGIEQAKQQKVRKEDRTFMLRTYTDGTLRAFMTEQYNCIDNVWYLDILSKLFPNARVSHDRYSDADSLSFNLLLPDTMKEHGDGDYGAMISCGNSEIGIRRFEQYPSIFRAICMNGCVHDRQNGQIISKVHRGNIDLDSLRDNIFENVNESIAMSQEVIERFLKLKEKSFNLDYANVIAKLSIDNKWDKNTTLSVVNQYKTIRPDKTLFGLIDIITRAGQSLDVDQWRENDFLAGKIFNWSDSEFNSFMNKAKYLEDKEIKECFGLSV